MRYYITRDYAGPMCTSSFPYGTIAEVEGEPNILTGMLEYTSSCIKERVPMFHAFANPDDAKKAAAAMARKQSEQLEQKLEELKEEYDRLSSMESYDIKVVRKV